MSALLYYKSKKVLRLVVVQNKEVKFEGDLHIDPARGRIARITSKSLAHPMAPKDALRLLKKLKVKVASDKNTMHTFAPLQEFFDKNLSYGFVHICPLCLRKGKIISLKEKYTLHKKGVCRDCLAEELKKELQFRGFGREAAKRFAGYIDRFRDFEKIISILERGGEMDGDITLYDMIDAETREGEQALRVKDLPIDGGFKKILKDRKVDGLLPVQVMALEAGLLEGEDLLVVSATASGKTLIAELAGVQAALGGKKFLYLVPLVALANQKYRDFKVYREIGLKTAIRVGMSRIKDRGELVVVDTNMKRADVVVGTYEGVDLMLRRGKKEELGDVGVVVIDEVHMLAEEERGPEIDGLIARVRYAFPNAQIIALSATVGNPLEMADHYGLKPLVYAHRPIPLERHMLFARNRYDKQSAIARQVRTEFQRRSKKGYLGQSLVFTNSRRKTKELSEYLRNKGITSKEYHGGLSYSQRKRTEDMFVKGKLACVVTTSALGAGVDFPSSQVIFETLSMGNRWITVGDFHQMLGRAGRPGYHDRGRVVLMVEPGKRSGFSQKETEDEVALHLLNGEVEDVTVEATEDEALAQILANAAVAESMADLKTVSEGMYVDFDFEAGVEKLGGKKLIKGHRPTPLGTVAATSFLLPSKVSHIVKNLNTDAESLMARVHPLENVYLMQGLKIRMQEVYHTRVSTRYFDGIGLIFEEPKEEFKDLLDLLSQDLMRCRCKEFPFCHHPGEEFTKMAMELRLSGLSSKGIAQAVRQYRMEIYAGDVFSWLDGLIRRCEAVERICIIKGEKVLAKEVRDLRRGLERPGK